MAHPRLLGGASKPVSIPHSPVSLSDDLNTSSALFCWERVWRVSQSVRKLLPSFLYVGASPAMAEATSRAVRRRAHPGILFVAKTPVARMMQVSASTSVLGPAACHRAIMVAMMVPTSARTVRTTEKLDISWF